MTDIFVGDGFDPSIAAHVREHGCQVNCVCDPDDGLDFAYSIGFLETVEQPEVIIFGLEHDIMHYMINTTLGQCRDGLRLRDGVQISGLLDGHVCVARTVHPSRIVREYLDAAISYHEARTGDLLTDVVQIVWPCAEDGHFPWEDGCDAAVRAAQPPLYIASLNA